MRLKFLLNLFSHYPILLGESVSLLTNTIALLRELGHQGRILTYETQNGDPEPTDGNWQKVSIALLQIQPEKIILGGQYFGISLLESTKMSGCVQGFYTNITRATEGSQNSLNISFSQATYPHYLR